MGNDGIPDPIWVGSKEDAYLYLLIGRLARFFHTPIDYFMGMDIAELSFWASVMDKIVRQENEAQEKALKKR